jgi:hypothetical protein
MSKKSRIRNALLAGAALAGAAKMMKGPMDSEVGAKLQAKDKVFQGVKKAKAIMSKVKPGQSGIGFGTEMLDDTGAFIPEGAKYGKMMKAKKGNMIMARGGKLARMKPTKLC